MKCKITRPNGEVVELDGTKEEIDAVLSKPQEFKVRYVPTEAPKPDEKKDGKGEAGDTILDWYRRWHYYSPKQYPWESPFYWFSF
jgi:hypothetical protein